MNHQQIYTNDDERALLLRVASGDELAFRQMLHQWQPFLTAHIFRISESRELAEEIVQDVFLKIWLTRETLADIKSFKAYLLTVSRNHALNALKRIVRELKKQDAYMRDALQDTDAANFRDFQLSLVDEAIDRLPQRQKEVYLLHRHERLNYVEIAERLGIGRETVKSHLAAAVKNITQHIRSRLSALILLFELFR